MLAPCVRKGAWPTSALSLARRDFDPGADWPRRSLTEGVSNVNLVAAIRIRFRVRVGVRCTPYNNKTCYTVDLYYQL